MIKKIFNLKQGDKIKDIHGATLEIISNADGLLFLYNTKTRLFETKDLRRSASNGASVEVLEGASV